ncbi:MAG: hypothetical protein JWO32_3042 [Bacteroidetes bacterium]|nr:hypothetical protein [Bacteroidota bacterium]
MRIWVCLILLLFLKCSVEEDISQNLKGRHWYVNAENWLTAKSATLTLDSTVRHDWEMELHSNHRMGYASAFPVEFKDSKGITHAKGERFTDTLYTYEIKNNIIKISKGEEIYYLSIQKNGGNTWLIEPSDSNQFEK